jgi:hypothetical protein
MLYNPAMLRKMEFVDIGRCNARQNFRHFFVIFFAKMAKTILFPWPDFLLLLLMPPQFIQAPTPFLPPSIEKQVKKVH